MTPTALKRATRARMRRTHEARSTARAHVLAAAGAADEHRHNVALESRMSTKQIKMEAGTKYHSMGSVKVEAASGGGLHITEDETGAIIEVSTGPDWHIDVTLADGRTLTVLADGTVAGGDS